MFGYIDVKKESLAKGQFGLWHTFLCGVCMSLKDMYGEKARLTAGWDINFLNVLLHASTETQVNIEMHRCASSPLKKRSIMQRDRLTDRLATANLLLFYFNALDDDIDKKSGRKKIARSFLKKAFKRAETDAPVLYEKLNGLYKGLLSAEKEKCGNIDRVCDYSALMTVAVAEYAVGAPLNEFLYGLCYNIGKWVYVIDALDDVKEDIKKKNFNALTAWLGDSSDAETFVTENKSEIEFLLYSTLNAAAGYFNDLELKSCVCVLKNIIYEGIREKTQQILNKLDRSKTDDLKESV